MWWRPQGSCNKRRLWMGRKGLHPEWTAADLWICIPAPNVKAPNPAVSGLRSTFVPPLPSTKVIDFSVHSPCGLVASACSEPQDPPTPYTPWILLPTPDALGPPPARGHWATSEDVFVSKLRGLLLTSHRCGASDAAQPPTMHRMAPTPSNDSIAPSTSWFMSVRHPAWDRCVHCISPSLIPVVLLARAMVMNCHVLMNYH